MKFLILFFLSILTIFTAHSQNGALLDLAVKYQITSTGGTSPTFTTSGVIIDDFSRWDATNIEVGDSLYVIDGPDIFTLKITVITLAAGNSLSITVVDPSGTLSSLPTGQAAIFRGTFNQNYPTYIATLRDDLRSGIMNRFSALVDRDITGILDSNSVDVTVTDSPTIDFDITGQNITAQVPNDAITNAKLAEVPSGTMKGGVSAGNPVDLNESQVKSILAYLASEITNTPAGNISATDVQSALNELDAEKVSITRSILTQYSLTGGGNLTTDRTINLVNDTITPGNNKVYGTNGSGVRGWKADLTSLPPTGPAGGDLDGTYPNPTVDALQGISVSAVAPNDGDILGFNGASWEPTTQLITPSDLVITHTSTNAEVTNSNGTGFTILAATSSEAGLFLPAEKFTLANATPNTRVVNTQYSLTGGGDLTTNRMLNLVNDVASPGNNKVYGTNGSGAREWKSDLVEVDGDITNELNTSFDTDSTSLQIDDAGGTLSVLILDIAPIQSIIGTNGVTANTVAGTTTISSNIPTPTGIINQTLRYSATNVLSASSVLQNNDTTITVLNGLKVNGGSLMDNNGPLVLGIKFLPANKSGIFVTDNFSQSSGVQGGSYIAAYVSDNTPTLGPTSAFFGGLNNSAIINNRNGTGYAASFITSSSAGASIGGGGVYSKIQLTEAITTGDLVGYTSYIYLQDGAGTTSATNTYGYRSTIQFGIGPATISSHYDFYAPPVNNDTIFSQITNRYGLYLSLDTVNVLNAWGLYQTSPNIKNYLNGGLSIKSTSPTATLDMTGTARFRNFTVNGNVFTHDGSGNFVSSTPLSIVSPYAWLLTGNTGTTPGTHFLGTTDTQPIVFKANSIERMRMTRLGDVGIGTANPGEILTTKVGAAEAAVFMGNSTVDSMKIFVKNDFPTVFTLRGSISMDGEHGDLYVNDGPDDEEEAAWSKARTTRYDTVYQSVTHTLAGSSIITGLSSYFFNVPSNLVGYKIAKIEYRVIGATSSGDLGIVTTIQDAITGGFTTVGAATLLADTRAIESNPNTALVSNDAIFVEVISIPGSPPLGLNATYMLVK